MEKLSFVIPCYGSETTIEIVVNEIRDTLRQRRSMTMKSSSSTTAPRTTSSPGSGLWPSPIPHITGIDLAKNFGQHAA